MELREPLVCSVDVAAGRLNGASGRYSKTLREMSGLYADGPAFEAALDVYGDEPVYEVTDLRPSCDAGDLIFGVTRMAPGKIGREYFFTRGHIHANANRPEIYYGESGDGVMLLESLQGETRTLAIRARDVCYVPPYWIHRSVNVGPSDLVMTFAYPADSGQNYEIIAKSLGMRSRVVDDGAGGWKLETNASFSARTQADVDALLADAR